MKTISSSVIGLLLFSASTASAQYSKKNGASSKPECQTQCDCKSLSTKGCYGVDVSGEFLYWKPFVGGTEFAADFDGVVIGNRSHFIDFEYHAGYRVGLACHLPYEEWKISAYFTSLHSKASDSIQGSFFPNFLAQFNGGNIQTVTNASARYDLHYYVFDLIFGKEQSFGRSFLWTPFFGAQGALIHQYFNYGYSGNANITTSSYNVITYNDFNGAGLQGGVRLEWVLGCGFRILGGLSGSLLWGQFNFDHRTTQASDLVRLKNDFNRYSPHANLMVALSWGDYVGRQTYLGISAGFESQYWWRQNQTPVFTSATLPYYSRASEDFTLHGLDVSVYMNF